MAYHHPRPCADFADVTSETITLQENRVWLCTVRMQLFSSTVSRHLLTIKVSTSGMVKWWLKRPWVTSIADAKTVMYVACKVHYCHMTVTDSAAASIFAGWHLV